MIAVEKREPANRIEITWKFRTSRKNYKIIKGPSLEIRNA